MNECNNLVTGFGLSVKDNMSFVRSRVHNVYASRGAIVCGVFQSVWEALFVIFSSLCLVSLFCFVRNKVA